MKFREVVEVGHGDSSTERTGDVRNGEGADFRALLLSKEVETGLTRSGLARPSPVQLAAIPVGRLGVDLIVQAKSGTGKTAVFVVLALEALDSACRDTQVLVLAPTREIATQIHQCFTSVGRCLLSHGLRVCLCIGGTSTGQNKKELRMGSQVVVGTPGRLAQLAADGCLNLDSIRFFALDEADKLMEDSYQCHVNWLFSKMPSSKQVAVFSATYPPILDGFLGRYMESPTLVRLDHTDVQLLGIKQFLWVLAGPDGGRDGAVPRDEIDPETVIRTKTAGLVELLRRVSYNQCLVFCNYQDKAELVATELCAAGQRAEFISAQLEQERRTEVIALLKRNKVRLLVSTDLTARGIDAPNINLVVNLETAGDPETYFHRIGRAGRFGGYGAAVTLVLDSVDHRRFLTVGSIGGFSAKTLPALPDVPDDLCSNQDFWATQPPVPFPQRSSSPSSARHHNGRYSLVNRETQDSLRASPTLRPNPRSDRTDPLDLALSPAMVAKLFDNLGMEEPTDRPSAAAYSRQELLRLRKLCGSRSPSPSQVKDKTSPSPPKKCPSAASYSRQEILRLRQEDTSRSPSPGAAKAKTCQAKASPSLPKKSPSPPPKAKEEASPAKPKAASFDAFAPMELDDIMDGSCLAPVVPSFSTASPFGRHVARPKARRNPAPAPALATAPQKSQEPQKSVDAEPPKVAQGATEVKNEKEEKKEAEPEEVPKAPSPTTKPRRRVGGIGARIERSVNSRPPSTTPTPTSGSPCHTPEPADRSKASPDPAPKPAPVDADLQSLFAHTKELLDQLVLEGKTTAPLPLPDCAAQGSPVEASTKPGELVFYGPPSPAKSSASATSTKSTESPKKVAAEPRKDGRKRYSREWLLHQWKETDPVRQRLYVLTKWPLVYNFPFLADPKQRCPLGRPRNLAGPPEEELRISAQSAASRRQSPAASKPAAIPDSFAVKLASKTKRGKAGKGKVTGEASEAKAAPVPLLDLNPEPVPPKGFPIGPGYCAESFLSLKDFGQRYREDPASVEPSVGPHAGPRLSGEEWRERWTGTARRFREQERQLLDILNSSTGSALSLSSSGDAALPLLPQPPADPGRATVAYGKDALLRLWGPTAGALRSAKAQGRWEAAGWLQGAQDAGCFYEHSLGEEAPVGDQPSHWSQEPVEETGGERFRAAQTAQGTQTTAESGTRREVEREYEACLHRWRRLRHSRPAQARDPNAAFLHLLAAPY